MSDEVSAITLDTSAFYEHLPADEALALTERFEFYFPPSPPVGSTCMIEIEFSALSRLCLTRRIPTLEREVLVLVALRKAQGIKIIWQFSVQSARSKLNSHYVKVQLDNLKFQET